MAKRRLFLDCDGVLADFDSAATELFGKPPREAEREIGSELFWKTLRDQPGFYKNLPEMPDAQVLMGAVKDCNLTILTGCPLGGWAEDQKERWAARHFPGVPIICTMSKDKWLHMNPGDVLVDDYLKYREVWTNEGGIFIHHTSAENSIKALRSLGFISDQP